MKKNMQGAARSGFTMMMALLLMFLFSSFAALIYQNASQAMMEAKRSRQSHLALLAAQSAIGQARLGMLDEFLRYLENHVKHFHQIDDWFHYLGPRDKGKIGTASYFYDLSELSETVSSSFGGEVRLVINDIDFDTDQKTYQGMIYFDVPIEAHARIGNVSRAVREMVRLEYKPCDVFASSYFLNNYGWFYGVNMTVNGDLRSNAIMDIQTDNLVLNGDGYSYGEFATSGSLHHWNRSAYEMDASDYARPMYYPLTDQVTGEAWKDGYNEEPKVYPGSAEQDMPFLGDLSEYIAYAEDNNGTVSHGGVTVDAYYDGDGFNVQKKASADDGTLVLIGTAADPIVLDGPVVVESDLIIGGVISGQGSFFVGRNIHIIDDLIYENPPVWVKPLADIDSSIQDTGAADFVGLCAKGSVILGDYTRGGFENHYMTDEFVDPYITDVSDTDNGYCNTTKDGEPAFDGDYTAVFGKKLADGADVDPKIDPVDRKYYSSSLSDKDFKSLNPKSRISHVDGVIYNNHLFAGSLADGSQMNGSLVCRNEAMILYGHLTMNWDTRLNGDPRYSGDPTGQGGSFAPYLPVGDPEFTLLQWSEINPVF